MLDQKAVDRILAATALPIPETLDRDELLAKLQWSASVIATRSKSLDRSRRPDRLQSIRTSATRLAKLLEEDTRNGWADLDQARLVAELKELREFALHSIDDNKRHLNHFGKRSRDEFGSPAAFAAEELMVIFWWAFARDIVVERDRDDWRIIRSPFIAFTVAALREMGHDYSPETIVDVIYSEIRPNKPSLKWSENFDRSEITITVTPIRESAK